MTELDFIIENGTLTKFLLPRSSGSDIIISDRETKAFRPLG